MKLRLVVFSIFFLIIACNSSRETNKMITKTLDQNWEFRQADKNQWFPAEVPGCVHTDLLKNGIIEDPFYRLNEHDQQWIDKKNWEYRTTCRIDKQTLSKDKVELQFEGLDTYAEVFLNGDKLLTADNMFREWTVDCKQILKEGKNNLRILLKSPINIGLDKLAKAKVDYPDPPNDFSEIGGIGDKKVSIFTRKAGYHFGWDWGPRLVTSGIWKPVQIKAWDLATLEYAFFEQNKLTNDQAKLTAKLEINAVEPASATISIKIDEKHNEKKTVSLDRGKNLIEIPFTIDNPKKWWPAVLGEQNLYAIEAILADGNGNILNSISHEIGLRTIEVIREPDSIGESFYFKVNGHPVFMKGANYIPQDVFLNRVSEDKYEHILQSAVDANMNMVRVWGGGIYEKDIFYELCDEKGLLVWQDFMFACSMYPGNKAFLNNVKQEAIDNVKRLRNHPSIAIWCGNNECLGAWKGWGWEEQVIENQGQEAADYIWQAYKNVYHKILPDVVSQYDSSRFYWPSSPCAGFGKPANLKAGDEHYWGVWWGKEPFSTYEEHMPRFMSEFGFQSFPEFSTVKKYTKPEDYDIYSEVMKSHQRSSIGNETIEEYMLRDYKKPDDFQSFLYLSQVLQAYGIKTGMEAHRRNRPRCMGSLYWQLDDCWPVASWSSIDYYGKWKALHHFAKKAFNPFLISPHAENGKVKIYIVSDMLSGQKAQMDLKLMDFKGQTKWQKSKSINIEPNTSQVYFTIDKAELLHNNSASEVVLYAELNKGEKRLSDNFLYFAKPKNLNLPQPDLDYSVTKTKNGYSIQITAKNLIKDLYLQMPDIEGSFSDNYFDLLPEREKTIGFETSQSVENAEDKLTTTSLFDVQ